MTIFYRILTSFVEIANIAVWLFFTKFAMQIYYDTKGNISTFKRIDYLFFAQTLL